MQLASTLLSLLLAVAVSAKGNGNGDGNTSVKSQCNQMAKLTKNIELAANDTKLANKFDNNQTAIDAFKAKIADSQTKLDALKANATLTASCGAVFAQKAEVDSCEEMAKAQFAMQLAANDTKLAEKFKNNATKIDAFKAKASEAATKIQAMSTNTTLTDFCSTLQTKAECKAMSKLQKVVAMANNQTALETKFKGNTTKIEKFTASIPQLKAMLDAMMNNQTLMDTCSTLTQAGTTSGAATSDNKAASFAGRVEATGGVVAAAVLAITATVFML